MAKRIFSRNEIIEANDLKVIEVEVPEWGEDCYLLLRRLTAGEVRKFSSFKGEDSKKGMIWALIYSAIDEEGNRLFDARTDMDLLEGKSMNVLKRLQDIILEHNGINVKKDPEESEVEKAVKG